MMKILTRITLLFFIINLMACSSEQAQTKEQILSQSVSALETRFESRKLGDIVEFISANYHDEQGRKQKDIKRIIQIQIMRHKTLYVFTSIGDVQWTDDQNVTIQIAAAMGGKPMESASILSSVRADMINFIVDFVLEDEVFKVKSASWKWARPGDFL